MGLVGFSFGFWIMFSAVLEPLRRLRQKQTLTAALLGMSIAHFGVGLFAIGASGVESYKIEKDVAMKPGGSFSIAGYDFKFVNAARCARAELRCRAGHGRSDPRRQTRDRVAAAKAPFLGATNRQQQGCHFRELGARSIRRHGRSAGRKCLEHAHSVQALGALHLVGRHRHGARRIDRGDRSPLSRQGAGCRAGRSYRRRIRVRN